MKDKDLSEQLSHFTGSETWYRHITGALYTEGVQYLAENAGAYWLIDEIMFRQRFRRVRSEEFQVWILKVTGRTALLTCEDGNGNEVHTKRIEFTDFPLAEIKLYFCNNTLHLPSEY
jgi:hypothetical protein